MKCKSCKFSIAANQSRVLTLFHPCTDWASSNKKRKMDAKEVAASAEILTRSVLSLWCLMVASYCSTLHYHICTGGGCSGSALQVRDLFSHCRTEMWDESEKNEVQQEVESMGDGGHEGGVGGHTEDGVLTIPWVISQLSMGSSWSAGLSSPFTLSWINNRTRPYTKEER